MMDPITTETLILAGSGALGGIWRAADWYLNHRDEDEEVKAVLISRNVIIGAFFGANAVTLGQLISGIVGTEIVANPITAFMYGMCGELIVMTAYQALSDKIKNLIGTTATKLKLKK